MQNLRSIRRAGKGGVSGRAGPVECRCVPMAPEEVQRKREELLNLLGDYGDLSDFERQLVDEYISGAAFWVKVCPPVSVAPSGEECRLGPRHHAAEARA